MQVFKAFKLPVALGFDHVSDKKPLQRDAVIGEIRDQQPVKRFGESRQMFVNLKNADGVILHVLRNVCLHPRHQKRAEERHKLLLTEKVFCTDEL